MTWWRSLVRAQYRPLKSRAESLSPYRRGLETVSARRIMGSCRDGLLQGCRCAGAGACPPCLGGWSLVGARSLTWCSPGAHPRQGTQCSHPGGGLISVAAPNMPVTRRSPIGHPVVKELRYARPTGTAQMSPLLSRRSRRLLVEAMVDASQGGVGTGWRRERRVHRHQPQRQPARTVPRRPLRRPWTAPPAVPVFASWRAFASMVDDWVVRSRATGRLSLAGPVLLLYCKVLSG